MIVLDTNVVSDLMRGGGGVDRWLTTVSELDLFTTVVTRAEIRYGVARLPEGRRRREVAKAAEAFFHDVADRTLTFDTRAADRYGQIVADREVTGRPTGVLDAQIAAIAQSHQAQVATRNVRDFEIPGLSVVDPFAG